MLGVFFVFSSTLKLVLLGLDQWIFLVSDGVHSTLNYPGLKNTEK